MSLPSHLAFDEFELMLDSGELFREGSPAAQLQPQPARLLELLAGRSGEVVSRDEIRQAVWGDSFVDFDASLNFCVKQLRRSLGDSATSPRYIETLPRRGYRFLRPVRTENGTKAPTAEVDLETRPFRLPAPSAASALRALRARWRLLTGVLATAAASIVLILLIGGRSDFPPRHPRLSVFPLACAGTTPADRQISGGITDALTAEIARRFQQNVDVIAPTSSRIYQESRKSSREIAKRLGATHLLTGTVKIAGGRLHITARLEKSYGRNLWEETFDGELMDAPRVYEAIAQRVAKTLHLPLPAPPAVAARLSREASETFLRGTYLRHHWNFAEAAKALGDAVLLAPRYAPAYAELALARTERGVRPQDDAPATLAAARRALLLDPGLPEAHLALANALFRDLVDWQGAEAEYRQALVLGPRNAEILDGYAKYLIALGRFDEALQHLDRARELDPASMEVTSDYAWLLFLAGRDREAVRQARSTLALLAMTQAAIPEIADFGWSWANHVLTFGSLRLGDEKTALDNGKEWMKIIGNEVDPARLRSMPEFLERRHRVVVEYARKYPGSSYTLAQAAAVTGRTGEALDALEQECRNGGEGSLFNYVAVEPLFAPLHNDPRFAKIVDCTRLPQDAPVRLALQAETPGRRDELAFAPRLR
jgi:DNA-binding winged helix-turn-helix (wHTH) protein/TolB-like protein/Flp pilus assembly protein TadD